MLSTEGLIEDFEERSHASVVEKGKYEHVGARERGGAASLQSHGALELDGLVTVEVRSESSVSSPIQSRSTFEKACASHF